LGYSKKRSGSWKNHPKITKHLPKHLPGGPALGGHAFSHTGCLAGHRFQLWGGSPDKGDQAIKVKKEMPSGSV